MERDAGGADANGVALHPTQEPPGKYIDMELQGRVALVAGGSEGIGREISLELARRGAAVAIVTRTPAKGEAVAAQIRDTGGRSQWFEGDFLDHGRMQAAADKVRDAFGPVDILVATGGPVYPQPKLFLDTDPVDYAQFFLNKCASRLIALRCVAGQMIGKGKGKVVFLTTDGGRVPTPSQVLVGAAAGGLAFATRTLALELARHGIRINTVSTTLTRDTGAWNRFKSAAESGSDATIVKAFRKLEAQTPFRLNETTDIAQLVAFLSGDASDQITGAVISVNGGISFP